MSSPFGSTFGGVTKHPTRAGLTLPRTNLLAYFRGGVDTIGLSVSCYSAPAVSGDLFCDVENGNDAAAGTALAPLKTPQFACALATAGQTVVVAAPKTAPYRTMFKPFITPIAGVDANTRVRITGQSAVNRAYISGCINVSDGAELGNLLPNAGFEAWESANILHGWALAPGVDGIIARESSIVAVGIYALRIGRVTTATPTVTTDLRLPANVAMTLSLKYRNTLATKPGKVDLWDRGANLHLSDAGVWGATAIFPADSIGAFSDRSYSFNTNTSAKYTLQLSMGNTGQSFYTDDISLTFDTPCTWTSTGDGDGRTYSMPGKLSSCNALLKCSAASWATDGVDALRPVLKAASLVECKATAGTWWFASDVLYYHLAEGESISDVHLEASLTNYVSGTEYGDTVIINKNYLDFDNIVVAGSQRLGVVSSGIGVRSHNLKSMGSNSHTMQASAGDWTLYDPEPCWSHDNDGIDSSGAGTIVTTYRANIHHNFDEGAEAYLGGKIVHYSPRVWANGRNGDAGSEGLYSLDTGSVLEVYGGSVHANTGAGVGCASGATLKMRNTIVWGNGFNDVRAATGATLDCQYNYYESAYDQWDALGGEGTGTVVGTDPLFSDPENGDFTLQAGSPCIGAGIDPFSDGDGDQYDAAGYKVWDDGHDLPDGHWIDGVDIGAYAYGGASKVYPKLSNPSEGSYIWESAPAILDIVGVDNAVYNADGTGKEFATQELAIAAFASLANDTTIFSGPKGIAVYSVDSSANADRINRALGN